MGQSFTSRLAEHGDAVALIDDSGTTVSYNDLSRRVDDFVARLGEKRRLVVVEAALSVTSVTAYLAALKGRHATILTNGPAAASITNTFEPEILVDVEGTITRTGAPHVELHSELALLMSTSGSTGSPKLVKLTLDALDANARAIAEYLNITPSERAITTLPLGYSYGLSVLNSHLASGASVILNERSVVDEEFWAIVDDRRATSMAGVPYTYELLEKIHLRERAPTSLATFTQAGGRLRPELVREYASWCLENGKRFFVMYGQTEATARMAYLPPQEALEHSDCIGKAIPGASLRIDAGELVFTGPSMMMGYATKRDDLATGPQLTELRTGDLAEKVGELFRITGRVSRFSKIAGLRVSLDDVERTLAKAGIDAVVAGDDVLIGVGVLEPAMTERALTVLRSKGGVPDWAYAAVALPVIPRLPSGKPDYSAILRAAKDRRAANEDLSSRNSFEDEYRRLLQRETVRPTDSFISLGGDSLSYVQVSMAIESRLGDLPQGWEALSVRQLDLLACNPSSTQSQGLSLRSLSSEIIVRLCAVSAILIHHIGSNLGSFSVKGGAFVLLMTAGYNLNRFQRDHLQSPERWLLMLSFLTRFVLPVYVIVVVFSLAGNNVHVGLPTILLVGNWFYENRGVLGFLWFMEVLFQCMLAMVLLFCIHDIRRIALYDRWRFAALLFVSALLIKVTMAVLFPEVQMVGVTLDRRPDAYIAIYAFGWLLSEATTPLQKAGCLAIAYFLPALEYGLLDSHTGGLALASAAILYIPRVRLWAPLATLLGFLAGCTFYIYLTHMATIHVLYNVLHLSSRPLAFVSSIMIGVAAAVTWQAMAQHVSPFYQKVKAAVRFSPTGLPSAEIADAKQRS